MLMVFIAAQSKMLSFPFVRFPTNGGSVTANTDFAIENTINSLETVDGKVDYFEGTDWDDILSANKSDHLLNNPTPRSHRSLAVCVNVWPNALKFFSVLCPHSTHRKRPPAEYWMRA